jgi:PAS domain S-box-containing protein
VVRGVGVGHRVPLWTLALAVLATAGAVVSQVLRPVPDPAAGPVEWALIALALTVAGSLTVDIRHRGDVESLDVFEVALAPAIYLLSGQEVVLLVVATKVASQLILRKPPAKLFFNTAQWAACAAAGSVAFAIVADRRHPAIGLVVAMFVVLVVNLGALVGLFAALSGRAAVRQMLSPRSLQWSVTLTVVTTAAGLGVATGASQNADSLLFAVALPVLLYWAGRGYTISQADLARAQSLQAGTRALSAVHDVRTDPQPFLAEVARSCQAVGAELVLRRSDGFEVYRFRPGHGRRGDLSRSLLRAEKPAHVVVEPPLSQGAPLAAAVRAAGWHDCLAVAVVIDGEEAGTLAVFDRSGPAGHDPSDAATLEALGRDLAAAIQRARLVDQLVDARRDAARIIEGSSDGIMAIAADGWVATWNPGFTAITGHRRDSVLRPDGLAQLDARSENGKPVPLRTWPTVSEPLPTVFSVRTADGRRRWLSCSYAVTKSDDGVGDLLVVSARDVTEFRRRQELIVAQGAVLELVAAGRPPRAVLRAVAELVGEQLECVVAVLAVGDDVSPLPDARWDGGRPGLDWAHEEARMAEVASRVRVTDGLVKGPGPYRAVAVRDGRTTEVRAAIVVRVPTPDQPDEHGRQVLQTAARLVALALERQPADDGLGLD